MIAELARLIPHPDHAFSTNGPDVRKEDGVHMHFYVKKPPKEVLSAYRQQLLDKGWSLDTDEIHHKGARFAGRAGDGAYMMASGGGHGANTNIDICVWAKEPQRKHCG